MTLSKYKQKRSFKNTPEPEGGQSDKKGLRFVVQKHDASHLHYDFRLEMGGVLKSWAVPKGPSLDPSVKRLAMMVEDHPYDYRTFEGIIPEGNYGAGTVIVWDEGTYTLAENEELNTRSAEKKLLQELKAGKIKFTLKGKKLKGDFALVKAHGRGENGWLLMKLQDKHATEKDILLKDKSVISRKTLTKVAATTTHIYKKQTKAPSKKTTKAKSISTSRGDDGGLLKIGKKAAFPRIFKPMLATLTDQPFDHDDWIYEIKWDGYRALSFINKGKVNLYSRNGISFNQKFGTIIQALEQLAADAVIDGEVIAINKDGTANFQQLQGFVKNNREAQLAYMVFDLLWLNGKDITALPLTDRKALLQNIMPQGQQVIQYSGHITGEGIGFYEASLERGLEGIMAKKADSPYTKGKRSGDWLKVKNNKKLEAVICGYTKPRNNRKYFGAVLLGKYVNGVLQYIGHTGGGFTEESLKTLKTKFRRLERKTCPFTEKPKTNMPAIWLKPELLCEVKFAEWTDDGHLRQPIFLGLRADKKATEEQNEKVVAAPGSVREAKEKTQKTNLAVDPGTAKRYKGKQRKLNTSLLLAKASKEELKKINGHEVKLTNLQKIYWPKEKITKGAVLNYYHEIAPFILPYLKDRPQSLNRHPNGINAPGFYQKDVSDKVPGWLKTHPYTSESDGEQKEFLVCTNEASLIYMASLGCIEMNPWHSRVQSPEKPDWCLIDLDPDTNTFEQVIETALMVKQVLDSLNVPCYCKTSGSTGIHIFIPLAAQYDFEQSKIFAELVVNIVHRELPGFTSVVRTPAKRKGLIYLDFLQNRKIQTVAAPYSLRPKPGATVSMPLYWDEVKPGLKTSDFTIKNAAGRLQETGDIFAPVLGKGIDLQKVMEAISRL